MDHLPDAVRKGMEDARLAMLRRAGRLCVHDGDDVHRVMRLWDGGFAVAAGDAPRLRGFVDLYDGPRHVYRCLVMTSREEGGECIYEFKRNTAVTDRAPVDFERNADAPVGYLGYMG